MDDATPNPSPILNLLNAFRSSQALFAAVDLGVFEVLAKTESVLTLGQLCEGVASRRGHAISEDGLKRLCCTCVALSLLNSPAEESYTLTPLSATYLLANAPTSLVGYCTHSAQVRRRQAGDTVLYDQPIGRVGVT